MKIFKMREVPGMQGQWEDFAAVSKPLALPFLERDIFVSQVSKRTATETS